MRNQSIEQGISSDKTTDLYIHEVLRVEKSCSCRKHQTMSRVVLSISQQFRVLALIVFLSLSFTAANETICRAGSSPTKRLAHKLSVDCSSPLQQHSTQTQLQSAAYIVHTRKPAQPALLLLLASSQKQFPKGTSFPSVCAC